MAASSGSLPTVVWGALCLVLFVAAVGASLVAVNNAHNGSDWKARAGSAETLVATLRKQYTASEAESKRLEGRTNVLAHEKADAEDKLAVRAVLPSDVSSVANALESCANGTRALLAAIGSAGSQAELEGLQGQAIELSRACEQAQTSAEGLVNFLRDQAKK